MSYTVTSEVLEILWDSLNERPKTYNPYKVEKLFSEIAKKGWATFSDVEDIFYLTDERLDKRQLYLSDLCESFGIQIEDAFYKPSAKGNSTTGFESIRSEDVALLLITLEKLGFEVDATLLVEMLLPSLKSRKKLIFSNSELQVFWYKRYRHKYPSITLSVKNWFNRNYSTNQIKTRLGYKLTVKIDEEGKPVYLEVSSPKFRNRPEPVDVTCSDCGHNWQKGDPDSSAAHRKIHRRRMAYLNPQPLPLLIQERFANKDFELVTASSPKWKHKEIYERAYAFKREMGFDFVQWKSPNGDNDPDVHGFLITNDAGTITGACSFRRKIFDNEPRWCLDWVWICPKERRNGHLTKRWKTYRQRFGNFFLSPPVSEMMQDFLTNMVKHHIKYTVMNKEINLVWYAVYGSNLSSERFLNYIQGGTPSGSAKACEPCNDTTPPQEERLFELQHDLVFARNSPQWQNGGVAFIDREPNPQVQTLAKLYLITKEQFNHVAQWETGGNPIDDINIDEAISEGSTVFKRPSWYGLVVYLGDVDNIPVFTLTDEAAITAYTKPSPQYLTQIVNGLRETYNYSNDQIYQYLKTKSGIVGNYKDFELFDVAAGLLNPKRDMTKKLLSDFAKEYDGMPEGEAKRQMKLAMDEFMRKYYGGFNFDYLE